MRRCGTWAAVVAISLVTGFAVAALVAALATRQARAGRSRLPINPPRSSSRSVRGTARARHLQVAVDNTVPSDAFTSWLRGHGLETRR